VVAIATLNLLSTIGTHFVTKSQRFINSHELFNLLQHFSGYRLDTPRKRELVN